MPRETKKVENYREASNESFASVFRSFSEINRSVIEFSKSSFNRAIEMQAQLAKKAYDSYISEASKLGQMFLSSYGRFVFRTGERPDLSVTNDRSGTQAVMPCAPMEPLQLKHSRARGSNRRRAYSFARGAVSLTTKAPSPKNEHQIQLSDGAREGSGFPG